MKVCYICGYWSRNTDRVLGQRPDEYLQAYRYVFAVKYGAHKMDFWVGPQDGRKKWVTAANFSEVRRWFGSFIETSVINNGWNGAILVHVPSKNSLVGARDSRSLSMLTEAMAATKLRNMVCDALRWRTALAASHGGGERRRRELVPHLAVVQNVAGREVVLIDDLLTKGGNLLACKDALEAAGACVLGAVTCGRTMYERETLSYGRQEIELTNEFDDFGRLRP